VVITKALATILSKLYNFFLYNHLSEFNADFLNCNWMC